MDPKNHQLLIAGTGFLAREWPRLKCGKCHEGILKVMSNNSPNIQEAQESISWRAHDAWEPEWINGTFHGLLRCSTCDEFATVAGDMRVDLLSPGDSGYEDEPGPPYGEWLTLRYVNPAVSIFDEPSDCPQDIRERMTDAARIILQDPSAAANRIRVAIETFLDHQKIAKFPRNGRRTPITTHARIEKFRSKNKEIANLLEAVKWIGNNGAHEASVDLKTALDGAEFFAHAMNLAFDKRARDIQKQAAIVNKRKGKSPRKR